MTSRSANRDGGSESDKPVYNSVALKEELRKLLNLQDLRGGSETPIPEQPVFGPYKSTEEYVELIERELNLSGPSLSCDHAKEPENKPEKKGKRRVHTTLKDPHGRTIMFIRDFSPERYPKSERGVLIY